MPRSHVQDMDDYTQKRSYSLLKTEAALTSPLMLADELSCGSSTYAFHTASYRTWRSASQGAFGEPTIADPKNPRVSLLEADAEQRKVLVDTHGRRRQGTLRPTHAQERSRRSAPVGPMGDRSDPSPRLEVQLVTRHRHGCSRPSAETQDDIVSTRRGETSSSFWIQVIIYPVNTFTSEHHSTYSGSLLTRDKYGNIMPGTM